jgi:hypothetical protein
MKKADRPKEMIAIEQKIRELGTYAKLTYHQWKYAACQLFKNCRPGFQTRKYFAVDQECLKSNIQIRFGWDDALRLYAVVFAFGGIVSYYGPATDKEEIEKYTDEKKSLLIYIPNRLKNAYKAALASNGSTIHDNIMKHITAYVEENTKAS